jgi:hypothetical protein
MWRNREVSGGLAFGKAICLRCGTGGRCCQGHQQTVQLISAQVVETVYPTTHSRAPPELELGGQTTMGSCWLAESGRGPAGGTTGVVSRP